MKKIIRIIVCMLLIFSSTSLAFIPFIRDEQQMKNSFFNTISRPISISSGWMKTFRGVTEQEIDEKDSLLLSHGGDHAPIYIDGNDEFTFKNGVTGGNGTENNPYLIENWVIIMDGSEQAISIFRTDAYFILRNCTIHGIPDGIHFVMVANARIEETTIEKCEIGMLISDSHNIMITDNIINSNWIAMSFYLDSNYNINISRNTLTGSLSIGGDKDFIFSYNTLINCYLNIFEHCIVYCNNIITEPQNNGLLGSIHVHKVNHVKLLHNYWWKPRLFPKFIYGEVTLKEGPDKPEFQIPWLFADWQPAKEPNDTS